MKICRGCHILKSFSEFRFFSKGKNGLNSRCKECERLSRKLWRQNNPEKAKAKDLRNRTNSKEKRLEYNRLYKMVYRKEINQQRNLRYHTDISFKLSERLRTRLREAIKDDYKSGSAVNDLGCSIEFLKQYLESKFQPGMTWENYNYNGWHIDHIRPLSSFDLTNRIQFLQACHYTNLQPLWAEDNMSKGAKFAG